MSELAASAWSWIGPALVVFASAGVVAAVAIWLLRRAQRSPARRALAERERAAAGAALVRLDDAIEELDLEVGLSGALYDGTAPDALHRAKLTAEYTRDASFEQLRLLTPELLPDETRHRARGIRSRVHTAQTTIDAARAEHAAWMTRNVSAAHQVDAARGRAQSLHAELGDPSALLATLSERFDRSEWLEAERAAATATTALAEAEALIDEANGVAADPSRSALPLLAKAERSLRTAQKAARTFEDRCRLVTAAAAATADEISAAREELRQAMGVRQALEPDDAARLGASLREASDALSAIEADSRRRPTASVAAIVRVRDRLDLAVGDARTAQQRLKGARTALPGALAAAREVIARAESRVPRAGADARIRLTAAQHELAAARTATDPVEALDAARRAVRHAEDAVALADYDARF